MEQIKEVYDSGLKGILSEKLQDINMTLDDS